VIGAPLNDHECLGKLTQVAAEGATSAEVRKVAARFDSTYELATWIRSLPQRNDEGDEGDGPRVACDVSQRARVLAEDPNCVERSLLYLAAGEVLDSSPVRQLATIETPRGRHTFPVEDGEPVVLDPQVTRNALSAGLYLIRQAGDAAHDAEQAAPDPADLLPWIAEVAEEPAEARDGRVGIQRVRRARGVFRAVLSGKPANPEAMGDVLYTLDRAEEAAPMFGQVARSAIRLARAALKTLAKRGVKPRNGCGCQDSTLPIRNAGALAPVIPAALAPRNINWKRLGYWGGKGLARVLGVGDLYDPAIDVAKQQLSRPKAASAAPRRQGTPPVFGLLPVRASPPSQTRAAQMPALLALLTGKGR